MSELKVYVKPLKTNMFGKTIVGQSRYFKSEVAKILAQKDAEIRKLKHALRVTRTAMARSVNTGILIGLKTACGEILKEKDNDDTDKTECG